MAWPCAVRLLYTMRKANFSARGNDGPALSSGQRVCGARYLLKRLIGGGEISEVWLAREITARRDVALKFLPPLLLRDKNLLDHVSEEIQRGRLLQHPHIVPAMELVSDRYSVAVAMEHVDGWSLAALKVDKLCCCFTVEEIEPWVRQIGEALTYAHQAFGLVHGDLKPSNLLLSQREGIKVSDFGFAALLRTESAQRGLAPGIYSGIGLLSPQQVLGGAPSKLDDIYSLGATIFELLTGTPPFHKGEIIAQICSLKASTMTQRMSELEIQADPISPVWEDTVAACLAKNPSDRPQEVSEVMQLLERKELPQPVGPAGHTERVEIEEGEHASETEDVGKTSESALELEPAEMEGSSSPGLPPSSLPASNRTPAKLAVIVAALAVVSLVAVFWFLSDLRPSAWGASENHAGGAAHSPGSLDRNFNGNLQGGANDSIRSLVVQPDGKILIGGLFSRVGHVEARRIARLDPDGKVEPALAGQPPGSVQALALHNDGKITMAGSSMIGRLRRVHVVQLLSDGGREPNWGLHELFSAEVLVVAPQPDGKVLVGGNFTVVSGKHLHRLLRLRTDGFLDGSFKIGNGASAAVRSIAVQKDGKILVGGAFEDFYRRHQPHLVRLNPDGSFDSSFKGMKGTDGDVMTVVPQANGKILIGGSFHHVNGVERSHIARLNADGSVDRSFNPGAGPYGLVQSIAVQSDGKVIVGGGFSSVDGKPRRGVARLNVDGSLDESFKVGEGASGFVWKVAVQSDGKILVAGDFDTFDGVPSGRIVRLQN